VLGGGGHALLLVGKAANALAKNSTLASFTRRVDGRLEDRRNESKGAGRLKRGPDNLEEETMSTGGKTLSPPMVDRKGVTWGRSLKAVRGPDLGVPGPEPPPLPGERGQKEVFLEQVQYEIIRAKLRGAWGCRI